MQRLLAAWTLPNRSKLRTQRAFTRRENGYSRRIILSITRTSYLIRGYYWILTPQARRLEHILIPFQSCLACDNPHSRPDSKSERKVLSRRPSFQRNRLRIRVAAPAAKTIQESASDQVLAGISHSASLWLCDVSGVHATFIQMHNDKRWCSHIQFRY